jgi:hypothetical protein
MIYAGQPGPSTKNMTKKNLSSSELRMATLTASQVTQPRKQSSKLQSKSNAADIHNDMLAKLMKSTSSNSLGGSKQKKQADIVRQQLYLSDMSNPAMNYNAFGN